MQACSATIVAKFVCECRINILMSCNCVGELWMLVCWCECVCVNG